MKIQTIIDRYMKKSSWPEALKGIPDPEPMRVVRDDYVITLGCLDPLYSIVDNQDGTFTLAWGDRKENYGDDEELSVRVFREDIHAHD